MSDAAPISRRGLARRMTVQAVYHWLVNETTPEKLQKQFRDDPGLGRADGEYFNELLNGTVREMAALDLQITPLLDRPLAQLDPVEHAVLLVAAFEISHKPDVPWRVVVNEAVNLAKMFGAEEGYKFVNGVLDKLARQQRTDEVAAKL